MKRINLESKDTHFIGSWNIENKNLCNEIINFFEKNKDLHQQGRIAIGSVESKIKKTTDFSINPSDLLNIRYECCNNLIKELFKCYTDYQNQWPFLKNLIKDVDIGSFNIRKYSPGDHFSKIHAERSGLSTLHRVFAWMTYLNDVNDGDGGETYFSHYGIKVKPEIGKTLIWPAEWTHAHSGEILKSGVKYIVTGWMNFPHDQKID